MKMARRYAMTARAESVARTRDRILDTTIALHLERPIADISLDLVAEGAGVSVQTVLRHFGNRAGLFEAALERGAKEIGREREAAPGDVEGALRVLIDHYEQRGDGVLLFLKQEADEPHAKRIVVNGRRTHRAWVARVFDRVLAERRDDELLDLLVVATDVYCWKLLRRDRGLSRRLTEQRMRRLVDAVLESARPSRRNSGA